MTAPDPTAAGRARVAGPGDHLALGEVVTAVEYDIVGQRGGRFAQVRSAIATIEQVRTDAGNFAHVNRGITWHVIARTTHLLEPSATESGHQFELDLPADVSAPPPPPGPRRRRWP